MNSTERISFLQEKLQEIRKYYMSLKSEVATIDRRRKRLKKKDREGNAVCFSPHFWMCSGHFVSLSLSSCAVDTTFRDSIVSWCGEVGVSAAELTRTTLLKDLWTILNNLWFINRFGFSRRACLAQQILSFVIRPWVLLDYLFEAIAHST